MTALTTQPRTPTERTTLLALSGIEAMRYARHPMFVVGAAVLLVLMVVGAGDTVDPEQFIGDWTFYPAFLLGVLGVFAGHGLARSMGSSSDAVEASPTDGVTRTAALCLACLVSGAAALVWLAWTYVAMTVWPTQYPSDLGPAYVFFTLAASVVYAVGGPLFGVMVGRWAPFAGSGLLAAVALVGWTLLGTLGFMMPASRLGTLVHLNAPFAGWASSDSADGPVWIAGGSPWWYLIYITLLCVAAATAAMLHDASGATRTRLARSLVVIGVLALVSLLLAAAPDPTRIPL